ncbi:beta strand repeat-containing protein [Qipengyuania flava]|uniref:beta strand repeat-containing protein n=1 Tax=Qipengyuania flava TaxID=192812 RepID=UPI001C62D745|nr:hypothetical protein [Qipengyuania flava]QYJ06885.1 hypothetical protein KUV82_12670 [Qipengyuania flava]
MTRSHTRRTPLLLGGAGLALAAALAAPVETQAQAFNGNPFFVRGGGTVDRSVADLDTITITTATAVIDWTMFEDGFGNALTFLPNGRTAIFQDGPGQGGFAVLNRILPSTNGNVVVFDGTVISRLQDASGGFSSGGTVAFYSPSGILVGSNAVFDVGQLLLTTLDPNLDSFESYAFGGTLELTGTPGTTAGVTIRPGAQIIGTGENSYFAVAAPQILMQGDAYINGSTAYAAGERVNLSYDNGLFNIQIPVGTSVATPVNHTGSTGGPSSTGTGDNHVIYVVARAINDPVSMLLSGNLGFDTAVTAGVVNGEIILSAGYDVSGTFVSSSLVDENAVEESISIIGNTNLTSNVTASATGRFSTNSFNGPINFAGDLTVRASREIALIAQSAHDLSVGGIATLNSRGTIAANGDVTGGVVTLSARDGALLSIAGDLLADATPDQRDGAAFGGDISLLADNGTLSIGGFTRLSAQANNHFPSGELGDGLGGNILLRSQNSGAIDIGGYLIADASAFGNGLAGRRAQGGTVRLLTRTGGSIGVTGFANLFAQARGGTADGSEGVFDGGAGIGGLVEVFANTGTIDFGSDLLLSAQGTGGIGANGPGDFGGLGQGGQVFLRSIDGEINAFGGTTSLRASGFGREGGSGGDGVGGLAQILARGTGTIDLADVSMDSDGVGGLGLALDGVGGFGLGGEALIMTQDLGDIILAGNAFVSAGATGGDGASGGNATGGIAGIYAQFGSIVIDGSANVSSFARGGAASVGFGGTGGNALGGTSYIQADGSQDAAAIITIAGDASVNASSVGGRGGDGDGSTITAGRGGDGTGGTYQGTPGSGGAFLLAGRDNGTLSIGGFASAFSYGQGGAGGIGGLGQTGGDGGTGIGGSAQAGTFSGLGDGSLGNGQALFQSLGVSANGLGGSGGDGDAGLGNGGFGQGGFAAVIARDSLVDAVSISMNANGLGGFGATGGDALGGESRLQVLSGTLNADGIQGFAQGTGGSATSGNGGAGTGGTTRIDVDSDLSVAGSISLYASGRGGFSDSGAGGAGQGGITRLTARSGSNVQVDSFAFLQSDGAGGQGATGGEGRGGSALADIIEGSSANFGGLNLNTSGRGGFGSVVGGLGVGGDSRLLVRDANLSVTGNTIITSSGNGGDSFDQGDGGTGYGGRAQVVVDGADASIGGQLFVSASGSGGFTNSAFGGDGGDGFGGRSVVSVNGNGDRLGTLFVGDTLSVSSFGQGGQGGDGDGNGIAAGNGGSGSGGRGDLASLIEPSLGTGAFLTVNADYGQVTVSGSASVNSQGFGGRGGDAPNGFAGGNGGDGFGGDAIVGLTNPSAGGPLLGTLSFGSLNVGARGSGGFGGVGDDGRYTGDGGDGVGGYALVTSRGGSLSSDTVGVNSNGSGGFGSTGGMGMGGQAGMATSVGGTIDVGNYQAQAWGVGGQGQDGRGGDGTGGIAFLGFQDGTTTITGFARVQAIGVGGSSFEGDGGDGTGGTANISIFTGQPGIGSVAGEASISANGFAGAAQSATGTSGVGTGGLAYARAQAGGQMSFGELRITAGGITALAPDGTQAGTGVGGLAQVFSQTGGQISADFLEMNAEGGNTAGVFEILATGGNMEFGQIAARAPGAVSGGTSRVQGNGSSIFISSFADFETVGDITFNTGNGGLIGGPSVTDPTARFFIDSMGTVTFTGDNNDAITFGGQELFIRAREVDIRAGARIGAEFLAFNVVGNDNVTVIGGFDDTPGFTLTLNELGRIEAGNALFASSFDGLASDDILVRDTFVSGSLDDGVSSLVMLGGGTVRVEGNLVFQNAAPTDTFIISAPRLEVVTPGGIFMLDPQGTPSGIFNFLGNDFWMADAATIDQLRSDVAFDGRNDLLASVAAGSDSPIGYLAAGDVLLAVGNSLLVRNTGTASEPGGITVTGQLTIGGGFDLFGTDTAGTGDPVPIDVVAFGRRLNEDGTFTVGEEFFATVNFTNQDDGEGTPLTEYAEGSQLNNCDINTLECIEIDTGGGGGGGGGDDGDDGDDGEEEERKEILEEVEEEAPQAAAVTTEPVASAPVEQAEQDTNVEFGADFPGLLNASLMTEESSIDDPVASGGDIALYGSSEDDADGEEDGDEQ